MHHGYYPDGADREDHAQAQVDMIDNALEWAGVDLDRVEAPFAVADVGCGIGGSARHIARRAMGESRRKAVQGRGRHPLARSGRPRDRPDARCRPRFLRLVPRRRRPGLAVRRRDVRPRVEHGERRAHARQAPIGRRARAAVCKPGGTIVLVTWCRRELEEGAVDASRRPSSSSSTASATRTTYPRGVPWVTTRASPPARAGLRRPSRRRIGARRCGRGKPW